MVISSPWIGPLEWCDPRNFVVGCSLAPMTERLEFSSTVNATPDVVWDRVTSFDGVNHELGPLLHMTAPRNLRSLADLGDVPLGERLFRSWVLFCRVIPIDYDDLALASIDPGRGFHERSRLFTATVWEHIRTLQPVGDGTVVTDVLVFEPRLPILAP